MAADPVRYDLEQRRSQSRNGDGLNCAMTDIGKLTSVSKRLKSVKVLVQPESPAEGSEPPEAQMPSAISSRIGVSADLDSSRLHATPAAGSESTSEAIGELRDAVLSLAHEVGQARRGGMTLNLPPERVEELAAAAKNIAALNQSVRELVDVISVSLPNSRWFAQVLDAMKNEGGARPDDQLGEIRAQLAQQQIQLKTLLARSAKVGTAIVDNPATPATASSSAPQLTSTSGRVVAAPTQRMPKREP